jgi:hypothetical protein
MLIFEIENVTRYAKVGASRVTSTKPNAVGICEKYKPLISNLGLEEIGLHVDSA